MVYIIIFIVLFTLELLYFRVADRFNIIDKPNERSSHTVITLRGGGIIFYFGVLIYFLLSGFQYQWFFLGLTMMTVVSFLDDIFTLSNRVRLLVHFSSVLLMVYQLDVFEMQWYYLLAMFVVIVGVVNAYNFMDGINGITACYSLAILGLLLLANRDLGFIGNDFLVFTMLSMFVFAFFNFRIKAKCFAGDVGSVVIAYVLLFAVGSLIIHTGNLVYMLFLTVYGIDAVWTIIRRLYRRENIFEAHRTHLYQLLSNEAGLNMLWVSFFYGVVQFLIGLLVIYFANKDIQTVWLFAGVLLGALSIIYLIFKTWVIREFVTNK